LSGEFSVGQFDAINLIGPMLQQGGLVSRLKE
jgi:hypothetical protein